VEVDSSDSVSEFVHCCFLFIKLGFCVNVSLALLYIP